jgi:hypothetical protein
MLMFEQFPQTVIAINFGQFVFVSISIGYSEQFNLYA